MVAGNPTVHSDANAGSANVNPDNMFNSPDGWGADHRTVAFDRNGILWIQTDANYSNEEEFAGQGNDQMLAGDPATGEIRRFLVGPRECEVTRFAWGADHRTVFGRSRHSASRRAGRQPVSRRRR